ncbi:tetratricopeptide repeat protein [Flavobacteriaceae bacterium M23B6Z8]
MKINVSIVIVFSTISFAFSQSNLQNQEFKSDSILYQQLIDSVKYYRNSDLAKAEVLLDKAAQINHEYKNIRWTANIQKLKAVIYYLKGGTDNLERAIGYQKSELAISKELKDSVMISGALNNLSILFSMQKDYSTSAKYALENLELLSIMGSEKKQTVELGQAYARLGDIYLNLKLVDSALINHQRAYSVFENVEIPDHYDLISASLVKLGYINHYYKKDYEKALTQYTKALEKFDEKNIGSRAQVTMLIGEVYKSIELYSKALTYYKKALGYYNKDGEDVTSKIGSLSSVHIQIAENYLLTSQPDSTLIYVDKVIRSAESGLLQNLELEMLANDFKSKALERKGDSISSLKYFKKARLLKDSIDKLSDIPETTEILLKNEKSKSLKKEEGFLKTISQKNTVLLIAIVVTIIVLICLFMIYIFSKRKLKASRIKQTELSENLNQTEEKYDLLNRQYISSSAHLAIKNDLLLKINELLERLSQKISSEGDKNQIRSAQVNINDNLELDKMWDMFFKHFEEVHPNYIEKLKGSFDLSMNELRLCAFIKMNLSYKEIGQILNVTQSGLHVTVHRLKKKLNLPKEQSVFDFLHSFTS